MIITLFIIGIMLLIFSIMDWKVRAIPSVILTGILFVLACLNLNSLNFGILGFIMAYLLYEADFFSGVADIKIMTMLSLMITSFNWFFVFIILTMIFGFFWKLFIKWRMKKEKICAFVPIFFFIYITMILLGGIR